MMGFRKVPLSLLFSPLISELTSFQRDMLMFAQLARDARNCLPYEPALLRSIVFPGRPFVGLKEIATARDHLVATGVFIHKRTAKKEWLEIAPDYRNNDGENETSFGEPEDPAVHPELQLGPAPLRIVPAQPAESRREKKRPRTNPPREHPPARSAREAEEPPEGSRALSSREGEDSDPAPSARSAREAVNRPEGTFARDAESSDDEIWRDLHTALGLREMSANGAMWLQRLHTSRGRLAEALSDYRAKTPAERAVVKNAAAWITWRWDDLGRDPQTQNTA